MWINIPGVAVELVHGGDFRAGRAGTLRREKDVEFRRLAQLWPRMHATRKDAFPRTTPSGLMQINDVERLPQIDQSRRYH